MGGDQTWGAGTECHQLALPTPSPHNTLYLELWCPAVAPPIVVTSNKGKTTCNFGDVAVGEPRSSPAPHPQGPRPARPSQARAGTDTPDPFQVTAA